MHARPPQPPASWRCHFTFAGSSQIFNNLLPRSIHMLATTLSTCIGSLALPPSPPRAFIGLHRGRGHSNRYDGGPLQSTDGDDNLGSSAVHNQTIKCVLRVLPCAYAVDREMAGAPDKWPVLLLMAVALSRRFAAGVQWPPYLQPSLRKHNNCSTCGMHACGVTYQSRLSRGCWGEGLGWGNGGSRNQRLQILAVVQPNRAERRCFVPGQESSASPSRGSSFDQVRAGVFRRVQGATAKGQQQPRSQLVRCRAMSRAHSGARPSVCLCETQLTVGGS